MIAYIWHQLCVLFMRGSRGGSEGGGVLQPWKIQFSEMLRVNYRKYASDPHQQVTQISDPHPPKNFLDPCMLLDYIHVPSIKHFNVYKQKISSSSRTFFFRFFFNECMSMQSSNKTKTCHFCVCFFFSTI